MLVGLMIAIIVLACGMFGMFYEFTGAVMLVACSGMLIFFVYKNKKVEIHWSVGMVTGLMLSAFYLLSCFDAVDRGMAVFGIIRYLWIVPTLFCYQLLSEEEQRKVFNSLPWIGCAMVIIGGVGYFIPFTRDILYSAGRFGGLFNYANTQAVFLLLCLILLCDTGSLKIIDIVRYVILLGGIGLTGSRIVMGLTIPVILYLMIRNRNRSFIITTAILAIAAVLVVALSGDGSPLARITRISFSESTLVGRLLYAQDALPLLLKHPFGMGYMGYYYVENSIQTGWYSTMYVHNDLLQLGLDIGIIPMLVYLFAVARGLLCRNVELSRKVMILVLFLHGLMDFDMTFSIMMLIMLMMLDQVKLDKLKVIKWPKTVYTAIAGVFIVLGAYMCIPTIAKFADNDQLAKDTYPWYTEAKLKLISESSDLDQVDRLSSEVLAQNKTCALAYYAKAMVANCNNKYDDMIKYGKKAIEMDYFNIEEYENYTVLLYDGLMSGDDEVYEKCRQEVFKLPTYMDKAKSKLSRLGKKIKDQPQLELTDTMLQLMEALKE